MPRRRGWTDITVTDQFCGAGGSSLGAAAAGLRIRMAMNHWRLAVETHNTNFPLADHDCCDVSAADPRRYPSTDILITSPECTTHSPAGGGRFKKSSNADLFTPRSEEAYVERSRATMRDVPRFAEYHLYRRIIVENVAEVTRWPLFRHWLKEMELLGYAWKLVSLNSMFCWPTPQSRDRLYIIFWRKGDHAPDMDITPLAPCPACERDVAGIQTWKKQALARAIDGQPVGKYRTQYVYTCPGCTTIVTPYFYAAMNALDFTIPAERIGDRPATKRLRQRTMDRIQFGLNKYGQRVLVVNLKQGERDSSRAWPADARPIGSIPTWDDYFAVAQPTSSLVSSFLFNVGGRECMKPVDEAFPTQETRDKLGLCSPFIIDCAHGTGLGHRVHDVTDRLSTVHAGGNNHAVASIAPFMVTTRGDESHVASSNYPIDRAHATVMASGNHHMLVTGAAQISLRDMNAMRVAALDSEMMTQGCAPQSALLSRAPFIATVAFDQQARGSQVRSLDQPHASVIGSDRDALVQPGQRLRPEDCYFRMLQPHEIGAAMAFPSTYVVGGNKRDRVKQYGNAVTPPAMSLLIARQVQAMTGDRIQ